MRSLGESGGAQAIQRILPARGHHAAPGGPHYFRRRCSLCSIRLEKPPCGARHVKRWRGGQMMLRWVSAGVLEAVARSGSPTCSSTPSKAPGRLLGTSAEHTHEGRPGRRTPIDCGGPAAGRSRVGRPRESWHRESGGGERRWGRRPARGCQEQTRVLAEQFSRMERDVFHVPYLSDKTLEAVFHSQVVKTVTWSRASPRPGPRAVRSGARKARWAAHGSPGRRTTSGASSSWACPRPPSPSSRACPGRPSTAS